MARGGRRQGSAGKSYSNRTDLNADRAVQPGSSAAPPPAASPQGPVAPMIRPDDLPTLDTPTMYPDRPMTSGLPMGPGAGPAPESSVSQRPLYDPLRAGLRRDPTNYALRRVAAYLEMRNG